LRRRQVPYLKPLPNISRLAAPFWEGLGRHQFLVPKCSNCGAYNWIPYPACRTCLSEDLEWTPVSGDATVWSFSIVHRGVGAFEQEVPYTVVLAKLAEEPRSCIVTGQLIECDPEDVHIGIPIEVVYEDVPEENFTMYRFAPRS
jgi:uncharacterized OB-fold protein